MAGHLEGLTSPPENERKAYGLGHSRHRGVV